MRKLISTFLISVAYAAPGEFKVTDNSGTKDYCLICEYTNVAATEDDAQAALEATTNACVTAENINDNTAGKVGYATADATTTKCVAEFFIFKDTLQNKFIYGVKRTTSPTDVDEALVDFALYSGVKAYMVSSTPANPVFTKFDATAATPKYMDGRAEPTVTVATDVQSVERLGCVMCHDVQKFDGDSKPETNDLITSFCWNPSANVGKFDTANFANASSFCYPTIGLCKTETYGWQVVEDGQTDPSATFVGIRRGCAEINSVATVTTSPTATALSPALENRKGVTSGVTRLYAATNTPLEAVLLAKSPCEPSSAIRFSSGTGTQADDYEIRPISNNGISSSADSVTAPDIIYQSPALTELECIKCETSAATNNDVADKCYAATTTARDNCDSLSCYSASVAYKSKDDPDTVFYYAKRGCTANPEMEMPTSGPVTDIKVQPGFAGIKQKFEKSTTENGNSGKPSTVQEVSTFTCYECSFSVSLESSSEPSEDDIIENDSETCFSPVEDETATSATCLGQCFTKAFNYKKSIGTKDEPNFSWNWKVERGCDQANELEAGKEISGVLNGVNKFTTICGANSGANCNDDLNSEQEEEQTPSVIKCHICKSAAGNSKKTDSCFAERKTADAKDCPDDSYTHCLSVFSSYKIGIAEVYNMERKCHKGPIGALVNPISTVENVNSTSVYCSANSCNSKIGVVASKLPTAQPVTEEPPSSALATILGLGSLLFIFV